MDSEERMIKMAYIAGALDGDGSFCLGKSYQVQAPSPQYRPIIRLSSSKKEMVEFLKEEFGGNIIYRKPYTSKDGIVRKENWSWAVYGLTRCPSIIEEVLPYLHVRKERAEFLLDYIKNNPFKRGSAKLSFDILQNREDAYLKMKRFNEKPFQGKISNIKRKNSESKLFWSYLAGLLDTDGSFSVGKHHLKSRVSPTYSQYISLSMIDTRGLNYILENCAFGFIKLYKATTTVNGFCYRWALHARDEVIFVLENVLPYLRTKKGNAEILLDFCKNKRNVKACRNGIPQEELDFRENCYKALKKFNYGISKPTLIDSEFQKMDNEGEGESHAERLNELAP